MKDDLCMLAVLFSFTDNGVKCSALIHFTDNGVKINALIQYSCKYCTIFKEALHIGNK